MIITAEGSDVTLYEQLREAQLFDTP